MKNNEKIYPLVSICIATYKRQKFLQATIQSILKQKYPNIEIIVSDNDPQASSKKIVDKLKSKSIIYNVNKKNLGVEKNFNKAFSYSNGEFIVFLSDDDPIEPEMISTLMKMYKKYPNFDSYYGACYLEINDQKVANAYSLPKGKKSMRNKLLKINEISLLSKENFLKNFLNYKILPYFWWSTGMTKRELIKKIGGMPDYGSLFFTDFTFINLIGCNGKMAIINKELGSQTIHSNNSLRYKEDFHHLKIGINGFYKTLFPYAQTNHCMKELQSFIANWIVNHLISLKNLNKNSTITLDNQLLLDTFSDLSNDFSFIKKKKNEFYLRLKYPEIYEPFFFYRRYLNLNTLKKINQLIKVKYF